MKKKNLRWLKLLAFGGGLGLFYQSREFRRLWAKEWPQSWNWRLKTSVLLILAKQVRCLRQTDHWDQAALQAYVANFQAELPDEIWQSLAENFKQTQQVGSPVYTLMFEHSRRSAKQKLRLVLRHLGGKIDAGGFLQLVGTHDFAPNLAPHAEFYAAFRTQIWQAYPTEAGLNVDSLGTRLHLLRSWFDRQNLLDVRQNFAGKNDWEKLQTYVKQADLSMDLTTNAAFHNRGSRVPHNFKVQVPASNTSQTKHYNNARMAEFIVDLNSGQFVSEWNAYQVDENGWVNTQVAPANLVQVANTESFNYGIPHGNYADLRSRDRPRHTNLDVHHPADPLVRQRATHQFRSPSTLAHGGSYVDLVKCLADIAAWQAVPPKKRDQAYANYLLVCQEAGLVCGYASLDKTARI